MEDDRLEKSAVVLRIVIGLAGLSLVAYIPYRYAVNPPPFGGFFDSGYALLFPFAALLGLLAVVACARPEVLQRLPGLPRRTGPLLLGLFGSTWMAMGLLCVPSLSSLAASAPAQGTLAMIHMTAQHVLLGCGAVATAIAPGAVVRALGGVPDGERGVELASGAPTAPQG